MAEQKKPVVRSEQKKEPVQPAKKVDLKKITTSVKKVNESTKKNSKKTKKNGKPKGKPLVLFIIVLLILVGCVFGASQLITANYEFYYLDEATIEYGGTADLIATRSYKVYDLNNEVDPPLLEDCSDDDTTGWEFLWMDETGKKVTQFPTITLALFGKTYKWTAILNEINPGAEVDRPIVGEGEYPLYSGDYYDGLVLSVVALYTLLRTGFKPTSYDAAGKGEMLIWADTPPGKDYVWGIYDNQRFAQDWMSGKNFEREHVWCNSRLGMGRVTSTGKNQASDLHNLRAIGGVYTGTINQKRSDRYFVDCKDGAHGTSFDHLGHTVGTLAFYPGDEFIGDVARIFMYMLIMYKDILKVPSLQSQLDGYNSYSLEGAMLPLWSLSGENVFEMLIRWHEQDPVDAFERHRNDVIYVCQGNRNPFIDNPSWFKSLYLAGELDFLYVVV